ncbi:MAG: BatA domain-containing protein [Saprospiraceae bacterium]|nr:BatA domain-containing protein [Saprospiraceae bacterium]
MQFLYPSFLWALLAIAIPIIIHLFYFRRFKKVYFTNVKYLEEIKEETSSRNRLKNLLILLSRILAVIGLVFAFAQPFIPQGDSIKKGNNAVSVFIDNSFSMNAIQNEIPLIDIAKEKARQIIKAYSEEDKFQILTHAFEVRHQRLVSKEDAIALIDEIEISPSVKKLSKVINRQKQAINNQEENEIVYLISDFQSSINDLLVYEDSTAEVNLLPLQAVQEKNISLDSVWLESPVPMINQSNKLLVKITNHSDEEVEGVRLSMLKDGQEKPEGIFNIPARTSVNDTINLSLLKAGWHKAELKISDFPVQFDDRYFIALNVPENIEVLAINNTIDNRYLTALFKGLNLYSLTNQNQNRVDYSKIKEYDLIILNDLTEISSGLASELDNYIVNGGNVLLFPSSTASIQSYNNFFNSIAANNLTTLESEKKTVSYLNQDEFVFKDVYEYVGRNITLPTSSKNYGLTNYQNRAQESLLRYRDGSNYLVKYVRGDGHLYVCTSPLDNEINDLALNAEIFVPMLYKMAIAATESQKIGYTIGTDEVIEAENKISNGDLVYTIKGVEEFIPGQTNLGNKILLDVNNQIDTDGFYSLGLDNESVSDLAFNYDRTESNMEVTSSSSLEDLAQNNNINLLDASLNADFSTYINEKDKGITLWKWCLIFALIFLAIETLLLRVWTER